eukprot:3734434-Pleurochrysis_carterae.AAC.1
MGEASKAKSERNLMQKGSQDTGSNVGAVFRHRLAGRPPPAHVVVRERDELASRIRISLLALRGRG